MPFRVPLVSFSLYGGVMTSRLRDLVKARRRARAAMKKMNRRSTYALSAALLILLGAFAWSIDYLYFAPEPEGTELTLDQLAALASEKRIDDAVFVNSFHLVDSGEDVHRAAIGIEIPNEFYSCIKIFSELPVHFLTSVAL